MGLMRPVGVFGGEHWLLSDEAAKHLGGAFGNMARHWPIQMTQRAADYAAFVTTAAMIYPPIILADIHAKRQAREEARGRAQPAQGGNGTVHPFPQPAAPPVPPVAVPAGPIN